MIKFLKADCVLWDFDGVLMDSMSVRDLGFQKVLKEFPQSQVDELMIFHRQNGGLSRYVKFRYFFEKIRCETITEEKIQRLADDFSVIMLETLLDPTLLIKESNEFVEKYHMKTDMFIVSGSDGVELNYICKQLGIEKYFKGIFGSPTPKNQLVKDILDAKKYTAPVLIGDSLNDWEAAKFNSIEFLGYNNILLKRGGLPYIEDFTNLSF